MDEIDIVVAGPIAPETGGIAQYIRGQAEQLAESDTTTVRTFDTAPFTDSSVNAFETAPPDNSGLLWFAVLFVKTIADALRFPLQSRPDVVHVHTSQNFAFVRSSYYVLFTKCLWRRPVVLHVHGSSFDEFVTTDSLLVASLQSLVFGASDAVVVLSAYWQETLALRVDPEKLHVLPNAIDTARYDPEFSVETPTVVFVSNHLKRKGIVEFTDAVREICRRDSSVQVKIAGSGPQSERAEQVAERYPNVEYLGYISENDKRTLLNEASVYALPSHAEGLPVALLEGMAGGNAIVSTTVGSIPDTVDEHNGILVEPKRADELASALEELVSSPETIEQMSRNNRELAASEYDWKALTQDLEALYRDLA